MEEISREKIICAIEAQTGMSREQFGSVSINSSDNEVYRVIIFTISKIKKGEPKERRTTNMSFEDALMVFKEVLVEIKKNRELKKKTVSISSFVESMEVIDNSGMKVQPIQENTREEKANDDRPAWLK
jgi:hypothetical protein